MSTTPIIFEHVEVIRVSDLGYWMRIDGREVFVGLAVPQHGTTIRVKGDRGRLVLPRWFVQDQGLPIR
jgi:hypothetical protein